MAPAPGKPSALLDARVVYCGDNLEQLQMLPGERVDLGARKVRRIINGENVRLPFSAHLTVREILDEKHVQKM